MVGASRSASPAASVGQPSQRWFCDMNICTPAAVVGRGIGRRHRAEAGVVEAGGNAAWIRLGGKDAAVEFQREFAAQIAGEHLAEELVISSDLEGGVFGAALGRDEDVGAAPEIGPALVFGLFRGGTGDGRQQRARGRLPLGRVGSPSPRPA